MCVYDVIVSLTVVDKDMVIKSCQICWRRLRDRSEHDFFFFLSDVYEMMTSFLVLVDFKQSSSSIVNFWVFLCLWLCLGRQPITALDLTFDFRV